MEIPFTPAEVVELNAVMANVNMIGETQIRIENYIAERIRHGVLRPWREELSQKSAERRKNIIANLPPEADAELQALVNKYSQPLVVTPRIR